MERRYRSPRGFAARTRVPGQIGRKMSGRKRMVQGGTGKLPREAAFPPLPLCASPLAWSDSRPLSNHPSPASGSEAPWTAVAECRATKRRYRFPSVRGPIERAPDADRSHPWAFAAVRGLRTSTGFAGADTPHESGSDAPQTAATLCFRPT